MKTTLTAASLVLGMALAGCQSTAQWLDSVQPKAVETAEARARFEMNCPAAKGQVLSREDVPPAYVGPRVRGVERAAFTVGVAGCDKRATYVVVCPDDGSGCFAADGRR